MADWWNPFDWWSNITGDVQGWFGSWVTGLGGDIASGLETGLAALFQDTFDVIIAPLEIAIGLIIIIIVLIWAFRNELLGAALVAGLLA